MYNVVRFEKVKIIDVPRIRNHNFRLSKNIKNVDYDRVEQNIFLAGNKETQLDVEFLYLKQKLKFKFDEKRQNAMTESVISASPEFFENKTQEEIIKYFEDNLKIFKKLFPDCPVLSAVVHLDESTPHLHFVFANIVKEEKKCKCSYEYYFGDKTRSGKKLNRIQTNWHKELCKLGYSFERGIQNTKKKHKRPQDRIQELEKQNEKLENENIKLYEENIYLREYIQDVEYELEELKIEYKIDEQVSIKNNNRTY